MALRPRFPVMLLLGLGLVAFFVSVVRDAERALTLLTEAELLASQSLALTSTVVHSQPNSTSHRTRQGKSDELFGTSTSTALNASSLRVPHAEPCPMAVKIENEAAETNKETNRTQSAVRFMLEPERFLQTFVDCEVDKTCQLFYLHVPKSGGTSIEKALYQVFSQKAMSSCCGKPLLERFRQKRDFYCQQKFSSWQLSHDEFLDIVHECTTKFHGTTTFDRSVLIVSFREPVATTLSSIHQTCNKNLDRRPPDVRQACAACTFESNTHVWLEHAYAVNHHLEGIWRLLHYKEQEATAKRLPWGKIDLLVLEPNDIDDFLRRWKPNQDFPRVNSASTAKCSFRLGKDLLHALKPAQNYYRELVAGH